MVISALLGVTLPIVLGYLFRKTGYIPGKAAPHLRLFVVRVAIPAMVFSNLYKAPLADLKQFLPMVGAMFLFTAIAWIMAYFFTAIPLLKSRRMENHLMVIFSNVGFMGWAVIHRLLGDEGLRRGIFFTSLWMINLYLFGFISYRVFRHGKDGRGLKGFWPSIIPVISGITLGIILNISPWEVPEALMRVVGQFASMTVPLILFSMGQSLSLSRSLVHWKELLPLVLFRHVIILAAMALTLLALPWLDVISRRALLIETVMPVATGVLIIGEVFDGDMDYLSSGTALSTLLSFFTLPLLIFFYPV